MYGSSGPGSARVRHGYAGWVRKAVTLMLVTVAIGALVSCDSGPSMEGDGGNAAEADQALVEEALEFGRIVLPPSAVVLGAETEKGIDLLYCLAVRVAPGDVDRMLSDSGFTTELVPGRRVVMPTVEGVELGDPGRIASAQDTIRSGDGAELTVTREVLVDRTAPDAPVVHVWLFTT